GTARDLVRTVRVSCRDVRFLITSREALGVSGEHLIALSSLPDREALELFLAPAVAALPDLVVGDSQLAVAGRICVRPGRGPRASGSAATRCRWRPVVEIGRFHDDRFRLLRGGRHSVERHRTLRAAVAWPYELLDDAERGVFDRMAVFADGTYLDGLVAVTG